MTEIDQAARRAAEAIKKYPTDWCNESPCSICERKLNDIAALIAAEFAPLLAEACGLLERANAAIAGTEPVWSDIAAFLAKHKEQSNG